MKNAIVATAIVLGSIGIVQAQEVDRSRNVEVQQYQAKVADNVNKMIAYVPLPEGMRATSFKLDISDRGGSTTRGIYMATSMDDTQSIRGTKSTLYVGLGQVTTHVNSGTMGAMKDTSPVQAQVIYRMKF